MLEAKNNQQVELIKVAEQGDIVAQQELVRIFSKRGSAFKQEFETEQDLVKAFVWLKTLAENGNWNALHCLADGYFQGYGIKKSPLKAIALLEELADKGDVVALFRLSDYYLYGKEVKKNYSQAVFYLKKLSQSENVLKKILLHNQLHWGVGFGSVFDTYVYVDNEYLADNKLADCYFQGGYGLEKNISKALEWLKKSANKGNVNAMLKLANCYLTGSEGVAINKDNVVKWLETAAESGNQNAQHRLVDYLNEVGNEESFKKRFELIETWVAPNNLKRSLHNVPDVWGPLNNEERDHSLLYKYANCFYFGRGVEKSYENAVKWFKEAAKSEVTLRFESERKGLARAQTALGICYFYGYSVEKNDKAAIKWFKEASKQNDAVGHLWVAYLADSKCKDEYGDIGAIEVFSPTIFSFDSEEQSGEQIEKKKIKERVVSLKGLTEDISENLKQASVSCFLQKDSLFFNEKDVNGHYFISDLIKFLTENKSTYSDVILAYFYKITKKYGSLENFETAYEKNDIIAIYELGLFYKNDEKFKDFNKASKYFSELLEFEISILNKGNQGSSSIYGNDIQQWLVLLATKELKDIESIKYKEDIEEKNKLLELEVQQKESLQNRMQKMVEQFTHSLANVIFPDTIYQVSERLKNADGNRKDILLLQQSYYSEKLIKILGELLRLRYANSSAENFRQTIRSCRLSTKNSNTKKIEQVVDYTLSRVIARFLNQDYAALNAVRERVLEIKGSNLEDLKYRFEESILFNKSLSTLEWTNQYLLPIKIKEISSLWENIFIKSEGYTEALLFGYFSEIIFNSFKYSDHDDQFLDIYFGECSLDNIVYLTCTFVNPNKNNNNNYLGTGVGLESIREDLYQLNDTNQDANSLTISNQGNDFKVVLFFKKDLLYMAPTLEDEYKNF